MQQTEIKTATKPGRHQFAAPGPGRPKGLPNKTTSEAKRAILTALELAGGPEYLAEVARNEPAVFCTLLGKVLPLEVTGADGGALAGKWVIEHVRSDPLPPAA
jgi:hypothetical protein